MPCLQPALKEQERVIFLFVAILCFIESEKTGELTISGNTFAAMQQRLGVLRPTPKEQETPRNATNWNPPPKATHTHRYILRMAEHRYPAELELRGRSKYTRDHPSVFVSQCPAVQST